MSAICWAAKAASPELNVEKIAPAMAVPAREVLIGREMGVVGFEFEGMMGVLLREKHLGLRIAMVAIDAAIEACSVKSIRAGMGLCLIWENWSEFCKNGDLGEMRANEIGEMGLYSYPNG